MKNMSRRRFLKKAAASGATVGVSSWLDGGPAILAGTPARTQVVVDSERRISRLDRHLFGSFIEHLGRAVYGGIYEPGSKFADAQGYRTDVMAEIRQLSVPIVRYPGGNFVSGYNRLDGVGPRATRPRVLERVWNSLETN